MEEIKKVPGGRMITCERCHKEFYAHPGRQFCVECQKEKMRAREKERRKIKREAERGIIPPPQAVPLPLGKGGSGYVSPEERFGVSSETGRIYFFVRDVEEYNKLHGTRLSYGQYENMLFLERLKRKRQKRAKNSAKIGAILQSQEASPEEVEKAYDSLEKRGRK